MSCVMQSALDDAASLPKGMLERPIHCELYLFLFGHIHSLDLNFFSPSIAIVFGVNSAEILAMVGLHSHFWASTPLGSRDGASWEEVRNLALSFSPCFLVTMR